MPVPNLRAKTLAGKLMKLISHIELPKTLRLHSAAQWRPGLLIQELNIVVYNYSRYHADTDVMLIKHARVQWQVAI